ncbi:MAG: hypothetical protein ACPL4H_06020 [Anaerolineales bacterium]
MKRAFILILVSVLLSGCSFDSTYDFPSSIVLDTPHSDIEVAVGSTIPIRAHTTFSDPAMEMIIEVNDNPIANLTITTQTDNPTLYVGEGSWTITGPGDYRLHVRLRSSNLNETSREVQVHAYLQPTLAPMLPASPEPTLNLATLPPQLSPPPTITSFPTITVAPSITPPLPIQINFWANELEVIMGNCTVLHWEVKNADGIYLNGTPVKQVGKQKICPSSTTTYVLQAQNATEKLERTLVIKVIEPILTLPTDTNGPTIQQIQSSYQKIYWPPDCSPNQVVISAVVNDPSGVKTVSVFYRVVDGKRQGTWQEKKMNLTSTNTFATTLIAKDFQASLNPPVESGSIAGLQYYLLAIDSLNNHNQSKPFANVEIDYCLY